MYYRFGSALTPIVKNIIIANVIVFILQNTIPVINRSFALSAYGIFVEFKIYQLITYQFLHGSFLHIFFNMLMLFFFGGAVEQIFGSKRFLIVYITAGVFAGLLHIFANVNPVVGASGSIFAVFTAFALYYPNQEVYLFGLLPVRVKYLFLLDLVVTLIGIGPHNDQGNIAHWAHLGGIIVGFVYVKYVHKSYHGQSGNNWGSSNYEDKNGFFYKFKEQFNSMFQGTENDAQKSNFTYHKGNNNSDKYDAQMIRHYRSEVDRLLDKINQVGYLQLTDDERKRLEEASDYLKRFDSH